MKVGFAWPLNRDEVAASIIVKGDVQRLVDIADPMPETFKEPKLITDIRLRARSRVSFKMAEMTQRSATGHGCSASIPFAERGRSTYARGQRMCG